MRKKAVALLLALVMCLLLAACGGTGDDNKDDGQKPGGDVVTPGDDDNNKPNPGGDDNKPESKEGTVDDMVKNFWDEEIMRDETVLFIAETDADGNVISLPKAKLLFPATEIISVKQYFHENNNGQIKTFAADTDFKHKGDTLTAVGEMRENALTGLHEFAGTIPYVTDKMLTGEQTFPGLGASHDIPSTDAGLYLPFTEGYQIVQMQVSVTYRHEKTYAGAVPAYMGDKLPKTMAKLKNKQNVELFVYGDSISTGANTSGLLGIAPNLPTWPQLVADNLARYFGTTVNLTNKAVGGWTSSNGVGGGTGWVGGKQINQVGLSDLLANDLKSYKPDIVLLGFGMNDATAGLPLSTYLTNTKTMVDTLRARNPECEVILVGTMLANPKAKNQAKNQAEYSQNLEKVAAKYASGVCVVDVGTVHKGVLDAGKHYTEISANNVNHPNDFTARLYAMTLLSAFIEGDGETPPQEETEGNAVLGEYKKKGYNVLFADPYFTKGISVIDASGNVHDSLVFPSSSGTPVWSFAQWATKYDISDYQNRKYTDGGATFTYTSKGKTVGGKLVPAKVLSVNSKTGSVYMECNAEAEYDEPRRDGESWPHTLLSQEFQEPLVHVDDCRELIMRMDYTVTKCEDKMNGQADAGKHAAQFVWYITLQNRTRGHADYGQYVWFGLNLWDNRNEGKTGNEWGAEDAGKADATGKFIYHPASRTFLPDTNGVFPRVGERTSVAFNVLTSARRAFDLAKERGYLGDTAWEDLYVGGMNFGFEIPGTYNAAVQVDVANVFYK